MIDEIVAEIAHEAIRAMDPAYLLKPWAECDQEHKDSMIAGVRFQVSNGHPPAAVNHLHWCDTREAQGWVFDYTLDREKKRHPNLVGWMALPEMQRAKTRVFCAIVKSCLHIYPVKEAA